MPTSSRASSPRIVSLLPSATEILHALGGTSMLVGRSHECDEPPSIAHLPVLTRQRVHSTSSAEIDRQVRSALSSGHSLYELDESHLASLAPDVILTQDLCDVCSIDLATVRRVAASLPNPPEVVSLNPQTLEGVLDSIHVVGRAAGLADRATRVVVQLRERMFSVCEHINPFADGPVVVFLEWTDPLFIGGHWTPQLIERAGGRHPLNETVPTPTSGAALGPMMAERRAGKSIVVPPQAITAVRPDAIIICPCGIPLDAPEEHASLGAPSGETGHSPSPLTVPALAAALMDQTWFRELPAVRRGKVALVDGNHHFNRPGPRLADALEFLVGWLHDLPHLIPPTFRWRPLR